MIFSGFSKNIDVMTQVRRINRELLKTADLCQGPVEETLLTQASLVASEQRAVAPVDDASQTPGALKASIRVERGEASAKKAFVLKIKAGGPSTTKPTASGKAYDYARADEFGTRDMQPRPFFFPIWRARRKEVRAAVRKAIGKAVSQVFK